MSTQWASKYKLINWKREYKLIVLQLFDKLLSNCMACTIFSATVVAWHISREHLSTSSAGNEVAFED